MGLFIFSSASSPHYIAITYIHCLNYYVRATPPYQTEFEPPSVVQSAKMGESIENIIPLSSFIVVNSLFLFVFSACNEHYYVVY